MFQQPIRIFSSLEKSYSPNRPINQRYSEKNPAFGIFPKQKTLRKQPLLTTNFLKSVSSTRLTEARAFLFLPLIQYKDNNPLQL